METVGALSNSVGIASLGSQCFLLGQRFDIPWVAMRKSTSCLYRVGAPCPSVPSLHGHLSTDSPADLAGRERRHQIPEIRYCSSDSLCWLPLHQGLCKGGQLAAREQGWKFEVLMVSFCQRPEIQAQHWPGVTTETIPFFPHQGFPSGCLSPNGKGKSSGLF